MQNSQAQIEVPEPAEGELAADDIVVNPLDEENNYNSIKDTYEAVGAGMGNANLCAGSVVFIINLDDNDTPGSILTRNKSRSNHYS